MHHRFRPGLFRRRKITLHVNPADGFAKRCAGRIDRPLPTRTQLWRASQHPAVERKLLVHESLGQVGRGLLDGVESEEVFPGCDRLAGDEG